MLLCVTGLLNRYLSEQAEGEEQGDIDVEQALEQDDKVSQEEEETLAADEGSDDVLQDCFTTIVETLANSNPRYLTVSGLSLATGNLDLLSLLCICCYGAVQNSLNAVYR